MYTHLLALTIGCVSKYINMFLDPVIPATPPRPKKVRQHFHDRYSLTEPGLSYPFLGVSITGVAVFWAVTVGVTVGALLTPTFVTLCGLKTGRAAASVIGLIFFCLIVVGVFAMSKACGVGGPRKRDSPAEEWEKER